MSDVIEDQYRRWNYPLPVEDMQEAIRTGSYWEIGDPADYWPLFWPARRGAGTMDILVAGCGTNQAAYYACRHPDSRVIGVDLSDTSLEHERRLKDKHGLDNLTLTRLDLTRVGDLGVDFNFIAVTGVLHHLPEPVAGLRALRSVLRPDGVINVMVYGTSLRLGVYLMQDLFRTMGMQQTPEDIEVVRAVVQSLPQGHVLRSYLRIAPDLEYDSGVVDTFLNRRDRSYYVTEVFDLAHDAGLEFLTWCDPLEYSLEAHVSRGHRAWSKLRDLDERDAAHACDLLTQSRGTHRFALAHPEYVNAHRIDVDSERFLGCTARLHPGAQLVEGDAADTDSTMYERRGFRFRVHRSLSELLTAMADGTVGIGEALDVMGVHGAERESALSHARTGLASLRSQGHVFVLLPE